MDDILPCPFCGESSPVIEHLEGTILHPAYVVKCDNCGAQAPWSDKGDHIEMWNLRTSLASAPVAGEAQKPLGYVAVLHSPCGARYFSRITNDGQARTCATQWAKEYAAVMPGPWPTEAVAVYAVPQASKPDFSDAYEGAREDLAIWKRRALAAERDLRAERETSSRLVAALNAENGPTHMGEPAPQASEAKK